MRWKAPLLAACVALLPLAARADDFRKSLHVEPAGTLHIDLSQGSVEVESHDEEEVRIEARSHGWRGGGVEFELRREEDGVSFHVSTSGWLGLGGGHRIEVHARVPRRYSLEVRTSGGDLEIEEIVGHVDARTSGGSIELDRVEGAVSLKTSGGSIRAEEIVGDLDAETSGGPIEVVEITGRVDVQTSGGRLEILDVTGPVRARTSGGSIEARLLQAAEGNLETSGGDIELALPQDGHFDLDARTSGGRVEIDEDLVWDGEHTKSRASGTLNGGGFTLRLKTSGGNINVEAH